MCGSDQCQPEAQTTGPRWHSNHSTASTGTAVAHMGRSATLPDTVSQVSHVINMVLSAVVLLEQAKVGIGSKLGVSRQHEVELNPVMLSSDHTPGQVPYHGGIFVLANAVVSLKCYTPLTVSVKVEEGMHQADHRYSTLAHLL